MEKMFRKSFAGRIIESFVKVILLLVVFPTLTSKYFLISVIRKTASFYQILTFNWGLRKPYFEETIHVFYILQL